MIEATILLLIMIVLAFAIKMIIRQERIDDIKTSLRLAISCGRPVEAIELVEKHEQDMPDHTREYLNQSCKILVYKMNKQ